MAVNGKTSMISPPSSVSNGPEPSQLPPYPPPLRSGQVLQPLSVFTGKAMPKKIEMKEKNETV